MRWRLPFSPRHLALMPISALMLIPLAWMLVTSIQTLPESRHFPPVLIPSGIHWENYPDAWNAAPFGRFFVNSTIVTLCSVAGNLVFCSLAGYAFARMRFIGRDVLFVILLATLMVPFQVTMIPTFIIVQKLGLVNSLPALIVPNLVDAVRDLPAAAVLPDAADRARGGGPDGWLLAAGRAGAGRAAAVDAGAGNAGDRHVPVDVERFPVAADRDHVDQPEHGAAGAVPFQGAHQTNWTLLMAGNVMALAPMLIVFIIGQRWFVQSLASTGFK